MLKKSIKEKGTVLIITSLILAILLILGGYFLSATITESRISRSQLIAAQTYYLAEAGINEAIWKLKNDPVWIENFETETVCENWSASFSRDNIFFPGSSYQVEIQNFECARGQIIAISTLEFAQDKASQRVIKAKVFKALGSLTENSPFFTGGTSENIDISASVINIYYGNMFCNNNLNIKHNSKVNVIDNPETEEKEGKTLIGNNISLSEASELNTTAICSKFICDEDCFGECPPLSISMPMIDFDSEDGNSYKSQALSAQNNGECSVLCNGIQCDTKCIFTASEFDDLLWEVGKDGTLFLESGITYVTGPIELKGGRRLTINGVLVADRTVDIGKRECWTQKGQKDCGFSQLTITNPGVGNPSGLLTKRNMDFGSYSFSEKTEIEGLIYSSDEIKLNSLPQELNLVGGLLARKISVSSAWKGVNIYLDNEIILEGVWAGSKPSDEDKPPFSPLVTIEHWEETY